MVKRSPFGCFCLWILLISSAATKKKTPRSIEAIFKGRCHEYQEVIRPELFPPGKTKDCDRLWILFKSAFESKDPCNVPMDNYEEYSTEADHYINTSDRVMFWSGKVFPFVTYLSADDTRYLTIRDVLGVYTVRNIPNWCGKMGAGLNYDVCPEWRDCPNVAVYSFWKHMSKKFALKAKGKVNVMLNASTGTAFKENSTFAKMELANLDWTRTPKLTINLVRNLDQNPKESCNSCTIQKLRNLANKKNISTECYENRKAIRYFLCVDQPDKRECVRST